MSYVLFMHTCIHAYISLISFGIWQTTPATDVASVPQALSYSARSPVKTSFGTRGAVLAAVSVLVRPTKEIIRGGKVWNKTVTWTISSTFFWSYTKLKRTPKPLLGCQNWVTKADGRHNLVPGDTRYVGGRRGLSFIHKQSYREILGQFKGTP